MGDHDNVERHAEIFGDGGILGSPIFERIYKLEHPIYKLRQRLHCLSESFMDQLVSQFLLFLTEIWSFVVIESLKVSKLVEFTSWTCKSYKLEL